MKLAAGFTRLSIRFDCRRNSQLAKSVWSQAEHTQVNQGAHLLQSRENVLVDPASERPRPGPLAHFVTFACYGARLHGDHRGSVDRWHNQSGAPYAAANANRNSYLRQTMAGGDYLLDQPRRETVLESIRDACRRWNWNLHAAHIRADHVHALLSGPTDREEALRVLKGNATKALREAHNEPEGVKRWARHGSVRGLWTEEAVAKAWDYIITGQGVLMAVYPAANPATPSRAEPDTLV